MSKINDLFGDYATPFKRRVLEKYAEEQEIRNRIKATQQKHKKMGITKNCSDCGSEQAWYSSDSGMTWQCFNHRKEDWK